MTKQSRKFNNILFGYITVPSCGTFGEDDGGFSIDIYPDGKLIYKTYIFDKIEKNKIIYALSEETINAIKEILLTYSKDIYFFNEYTDNGSDDGDCNIFIFLGKRVISWNIDYYDENKLKENESKYYKKYINAIIQENIMLEIFEKISNILKIHGIILSIYQIVFSKKLFISEYN